ncbi:WbuC family cupin fold metalloprotein [Aeromonas sp. FDAARGOS 1416]|uniref:WbuC family cupin fold metalloprotein n=1 Tax=Aeromonas TaxID=642 RepID=UPI001C2450FB|nr:WbuC family cupin fold metalloprotein [Aeromonas sp. FDAARGOS 1416]QXB02316.1 WbuC family cupin fold metalloprotein [Aeromonas sp. FDAARGOS 1416]
MKLLESQLLMQLYRDAAASERLRTHYLLHASHTEKVQRLLIAMVKGSYVEPHFHQFPHQWEMFTLISGVIRVCLYESNGDVRHELIINAQDPLPLVEFLPNEIHSVECLSDYALLLEIKEGPFDARTSKSFLLL